MGRRVEFQDWSCWLYTFCSLGYYTSSTVTWCFCLKQVATKFRNSVNLNFSVKSNHRSNSQKNNFVAFWKIIAGQVSARYGSTNFDIKYFKYILICTFCMCRMRRKVIRFGIIQQELFLKALAPSNIV